MQSRPRTTWLLALLLVPLLAMGLRLWGLNTSETWDEVAYYDAAHDYYQNVSNNRWADAAAWQANREHPAVAKWLYLVPSLGAIRADVHDLNPGRLTAAMLGSLTVLLTMLLARRLFSWSVGLVAGVTLALLPTVIGLNRVLGLDTPLTFFFVLCLWAFVEATTRSQKSEGLLTPYSLLLTPYSWPAWVWHLIAIMALGLAIGTRLTGVLLWPILAMIWLIVVGQRSQKRDVRRADWSSCFSSLWQQLKSPATFVIAALYLVIPPLIVFATWPWLWHDTIAHWQITLGHWSPVATFFLGVLQDPGPDYYVIYFLTTFPALFVLLCIVWAARTIVRGQRSDWILLVWIAAVFAFSFYGLRQGGFRYLLPLVPALVIAAAAYLDELARSMSDQRARWLLPALFTVYLIPHALLHQPYQLDYYNELTGGTNQVATGQWLQVGWWGEGVDEAVEWLNAHAPYNATVSYTALPDRARFRLRSDFDHTVALPDYILTNPAYTWQLTEYPWLDRYALAYTVRVQGAHLAEVWERVE